MRERRGSQEQVASILQQEIQEKISSASELKAQHPLPNFDPLGSDTSWSLSGNVQPCDASVNLSPKAIERKQEKDKFNQILG